MNHTVVYFVRLLGRQARGRSINLAAREPDALPAQPAQLLQPGGGPPVRVPRHRAERGRPLTTEHCFHAGQGSRS